MFVLRARRAASLGPLLGICVRDELSQFGFVLGKEGLFAALRGFNFGAGRLPQTGAQKTDRAEMAKVLQCILADFELVPRPPEGCAPRTGEPVTDRLEQVVFEIMHELEKRRIF